MNALDEGVLVNGFDPSPTQQPKGQNVNYSSGQIKIGTQSDDEWQNRALLLRAHRQSVLATNIANADTPGYRALEFDFPEAMRSAQKAFNCPKLVTSSEGHAESNSLAPVASTLDFIRYARPAQTSLDSNSVDMNRERASFAQNTILYQLALKSVEEESSDMNLATSDPMRSA